MVYRTISLYDFIRQKVGKDEINKILSDFSCPLNEEINSFIHEKAYDFERVGLARTYLVYALVDETPVLVAFYTLGQSNVKLSDDLSVEMKKKIFGTSYPMGNVVKTLLIGQLSKNYNNGNDKYITGEDIMNLVFARIREIHLLFPSVVIHVDCKDVLKLKEYYEKLGFMLFKKHETTLVYLMPTNNIFDLMIV